MNYEPPPKPPIKVKRVKAPIPKPKTIGKYKWYSGTERFSDGSQDTWKYWAPTLRPSKGKRNG